MARIIANQTKATFIDFSAVTSGIKEIRTVMQRAEENRRYGEKTIVFVDEIHRFNKAQQDAFLPFVEKGSIILIGATTENPSFEINGALLSRCKVFVLQALQPDELKALLQRALRDERGFGQQIVHIDDEMLEMIAVFANGDARTALSTLEMVILNGDMAEDGAVTVTTDTLEQCISKKSLLYDKNGEEHYNLISALHKSMRNSDPDAAVYWLARMLEAGEDPLYVARRVTRFASEDIGLADPPRPRDRHRRLPGLPLHRYARMQRPSHRSRRLYGPGPQIQRPLYGLRTHQKRRPQTTRRTRPPSHPQRRDQTHERTRLRQRLPIRPRQPRQTHQYAVSSR